MIPKNFEDILKNFEKKRNANFARRFQNFFLHFSYIYLNPMVNFWVRSLRIFRNLTPNGQFWGMGIYIPSTPLFVAIGSSHEIHISTALRSTSHSGFAKDLRREVSWGGERDWGGRLSGSEQIHSRAPEFVARNLRGIYYSWRSSLLDGQTSAGEHPSLWCAGNL